MNHASVLHKRATLRKISIKVFINQHHHKPNAWCSGSAQQSYLRDPGSKPRHGLFFLRTNTFAAYFFSELIHLYKTFNTSWNNKKWCSAVERWVPHILRTRDRIPLFLCFLFIPGACSPPFFYHRWARARATQAAWAPKALCSPPVFLFTFSFQ